MFFYCYIRVLKHYFISIWIGYISFRLCTLISDHYNSVPTHKKTQIQSWNLLSDSHKWDIYPSSFIMAKHHSSLHSASFQVQAKLEEGWKDESMLPGEFLMDLSSWKYNGTAHHCQLYTPHVTLQPTVALLSLALYVFFPKNVRSSSISLVLISAIFVPM